MSPLTSNVRVATEVLMAMLPLELLTMNVEAPIMRLLLMEMFPVVLMLMGLARSPP